MSTVDEIKAAIEKLSLTERAEVARFIHGWTDDAWDEQIKNDFDAGKLDVLLQEVRDDIVSGRVKYGQGSAGQKRPVIEHLIYFTQRLLGKSLFLTFPPSSSQ